MDEPTKTRRGPVRDPRAGAARAGLIPIAQVLAGALAPLMIALGAAAADLPDRIISRRLNWLPRERYQALRDEWRAYAEAHPNDPLGWTQLAKASRYSGDDCTEAAGYARRAIEIAPDYADAHATLAGTCWEQYCPDCGMDGREAARELERAVALNPADAEPHFTLWVVRLSLGDAAGAEASLRALIEGGRIPEPVLDFGYNLLIGLEPNAIVLTNGDNDTYPPLALQAARGVRPDVSVVNLSLLNTQYYREHWRRAPQAVPVPVMAEAPPGPQAGEAVKGLVAALEAEGWKRPLYIAVTIPEGNVQVRHTLSLEGLAYRVLPGAPGETTVDVGRLQENLFARYRMDSAASLAFDWVGCPGVRRLIPNYVSLYSRLASGLAESGRMEPAAGAMRRALRLCDFHGETEMGRAMVKHWLEWDSGSAEAAQWKRRFGG